MRDAGQRTADALLVLQLATEITELLQQLAESQEVCIELAVDAGELQAENEALREQLATVKRERDACQAEAMRLRSSAAA